MEGKIKKLQLNKEIIAKLDQASISGGEAVHSVHGYKCGGGVVGASDLLDAKCGGGGGVVSDNCGFTGYTANQGETTVPYTEQWGHECW